MRKPARRGRLPEQGINMTVIYSSTSSAVRSLLKAKKFRIEDPLSEQLVRSLTTKVFYTLAHYKLLDKFEGVIDLGPVTIIPYRSILGDIRYVLELKGLQDSAVVVQWNGKFEKLGKERHSDFFISEKDFNVTNCLDNFVAFEQQVVQVLQAIEAQFFEATKVNVAQREEETPVMHTHNDEESDGSN